MVLPAVLCHPALDPEQARGRDRAVRVDRHSGAAAVARHLAGEICEVPAALQAVLLVVRGHLHSLGLAWLETAGRGLCHHFAPVDAVAFPPLYRRAAVARGLLTAAPAPHLDLGAPQ